MPAVMKKGKVAPYKPSHGARSLSDDVADLRAEVKEVRGDIKRLAELLGKWFGDDFDKAAKEIVGKLQG